MTESALRMSVSFPASALWETNNLLSWNENGYTSGMKNQYRSVNVQDHILPDGSMSSEFKEFLADAFAKTGENTVDHS